MASNKDQNWKKLILKSSLLIGLIFANWGLNVSLAQTTTGEDYRHFNVGKYLTINDTLQTTNSQIGVDNLGLEGKQDQKYLSKDNANPVGAFIVQIINLIALTSASLSFLAVVVAGFMMVTAAGEANQLNRAKDILTKGLIGLAITLSAYFIVAFVQNLLFETVSK